MIDEKKTCPGYAAACGLGTCDHLKAAPMPSAECSNCGGHPSGCGYCRSTCSSGAGGITVLEVRSIADYLDRRDCASSLDGYDLIAGLRAAADLLEGKDVRIGADVDKQGNLMGHTTLRALPFTSATPEPTR